MADGQGTADPLELEHMIGYTGEGAQSIQYHPTERDTLVGYIGRLVLIANVHDKHQQEFLHGHNEEVTALAVSPSGNLIASGQGSSRCVPNSEAMVIVWDWKTRQSIYRYTLALRVWHTLTRSLTLALTSLQPNLVLTRGSTHDHSLASP